MLGRGLALAVAVILAPGLAAAHGRPPLLGYIVSSPADPRVLYARGTWGLAVSRDGGARWRWLCAAAMGVDARSEDPTLRAMSDGSLLAGTFGGLLRSEDGACSWDAPEPALEGRYVVTLAVGGGAVYAIAAEPGQRDVLYRSLDAGLTWAPHGDGFGEVLVGSLVAAPSNPQRLYGAGQIPPRAAGEPRRAFLVVSDDGGLTFTPRELTPLEAGERELAVWAVDPNNADRVYAQVLHFNGEEAPERVVRSDDAGLSWSTVLRAPYLGGLLARADGSVLVGSRLGGLWRAEDGATFAPLDADVAVACLHDATDTVWMCVDEARSGYALASSTDGRAFAPALRLSDIDELAPCPACTAGAVVCPAWRPDVIYDLGLDAALPPGFDPDGGTGAPRDASTPAECAPDGGPGGPGSTGCGCRSAPRGAGRLPLALGLFAAAMLRFRHTRSRICRR